MSSQNLMLMLVVFTINTISMYSQQSFPAHVDNLLDDALSKMGMNRRDCFMRSDAVKKDTYRLPVVDNVFTKPLSIFNVTQNYSQILSAYKIDDAAILFDRVFRDLNINKFRQIEYPDTNQVEYIVKSVKTKDGKNISWQDIPEKISIPLFKLIINPVIESYKNTASIQKKLLKYTNVVEHCDSLLMMSEEDSKSNPFEIYFNEVRADSVSKQFFDDCSFIDLKHLYENALSLYIALENSSLGLNNNKETFADCKQTYILETIYGKIAIGGVDNDTYTDDYLLILDLGGNDVYHSSMLKSEVIQNPVRCIIDLSGNDTYLGGDYSFASGVFGYGILIDFNGDDLYKAGSFSLGAGLFGVGILHDSQGADIYSGKVFSEGAGAFGIGVLIDNSGNDTYNVQANGQAFGYVKGIGLLADDNGNDVYTTSSPFVDILRYDSHFVSFTQGASLGQRPIASGGIGILIDANGNDTYTSDIYGQGTSYWFGIGALYDLKGEDRYQSYQYAQGAGIHFAHGLLWDADGNDVYVSHGVSQGCGHDVGMGMLLDEKGDDSYVAESLSLGGGNANAISLFFDVEGDDSYIAKNSVNTFGYSDFRRNYGMIGVFYDAAGKDGYSDETKNNKVLLKSTFGAFLDIDGATENVKKSNVAVSDNNTKDQIVYEKLSNDSLFILASTAPQKFQFHVKPARDEIVKRGSLIYNFMATKFNTESPRQRLALEYIIPVLYTQDSVSIQKLLVDSLESKEYTTSMFSLWAIGKCKVKNLSNTFKRLLKSNDWRIRAATAQQIGESGCEENCKDLQLLLNDSIPLVRARAAYSLAQLRPENIVDILKTPLQDKFQLVRNSAAMGLKNKPLPQTIFQSLLKKYNNVESQISVARLLPFIDTATVVKEFVSDFMSLSAEVTNVGIQALIEKYGSNIPIVFTGVMPIAANQTNQLKTSQLEVISGQSAHRTMLPRNKKTK